MRKVYLVASNGNETFGEETISKLKTETATEFRKIIAEICADYAYQLMAGDPHRQDWNLFELTILDDRGLVIASKPFPQTREPDLPAFSRAIYDAVHLRIESR